MARSNQINWSESPDLTRWSPSCIHFQYPYHTLLYISSLTSF